MSTVNGFQVGSETLKYNYESLDNYNTPNFSTSSSTTYAVGDYVMYNGKLYKCTTATTGGTWVSGSWTEAVLSDDVNDLSRQLNDVDGAINDQPSETVLAKTISAGFINHDGTIDPNFGGYSICTLKGAELIESIVVSDLSADYKYYCFYDSFDNAIDYLSSLPVDTEITVPDGASIIRICSATAAINSAVITAVKYNDMHSLFVDVDNLSNAIEYGNLKIRPFIARRFIDNNGNASEDQNYAATNFVAIDDGVQYLYTVSPSACEWNCFYDVSRNKVAKFTVPAGKGIIPIPETAKYFRMSNFTADMGNLVVYSYLKSNILTESTETTTDYSSGFSGNVISLNPGIKAKMLQAKTNVVTLLHCSDIHISTGSLGNLRDVVKFSDKYNTIIDDAICTGDMVGQKFSDTYYSQVWDANGGGKILTCIGNHDCTEGGDEYARVEHTQAEVYAKFIEPYVTGQNPSWGTVSYQPNITYWYKDYADKGTRLISMNSMLTDAEATAQNTWLQGVLSDALTNGYSVIILTHYGPYNGVKIDCNFTDVDEPVLSGFNAMYQESVKTFIDGGGDFVCYLSGHTHYDLICKNSNYPNQLFVVVTGLHGDFAEDTKPYNRFNVITFDKTNHVVKIMRVGGDRNKYMRHIGLITINYRTLDVVYSE